MAEFFNVPSYVLSHDPRHRQGCSLWHIPYDLASCGCAERESLADQLSRNQSSIPHVTNLNRKLSRRLGR